MTKRKIVIACSIALLSVAANACPPALAAASGYWTTDTAPSGTWRLRTYTCGYCFGPVQTQTDCASYNAHPTSKIEDWDPVKQDWVVTSTAGSCTDYFTINCPGA